MAVTSLPRPTQSELLQLKLLEPQSLIRAQRFASELGQVLSPTQVRAFLDCSARWWFRYGLHLPEPKTSSLALGSALHRALEANFREKISTGEGLSSSRNSTSESWSSQASLNNATTPRVKATVIVDNIRYYLYENVKECLNHASTGAPQRSGAGREERRQNQERTVSGSVAPLYHPGPVPRVAAIRRRAGKKAWPQRERCGTARR